MSKYKAGDKVVIRKDLVVDENSIWGRGISKLMDCDYVVVNHVTTEGVGVVRLSDPEVSWVVTDEMVEGLYEESKKYIWYLDDVDRTYFLYDEKSITWGDTNSRYITNIKDGKDDIFLLTEEQAKKSPFFDKFAKHDPFEEKLYYIRMKNGDGKFLNSITDEGEYFMGTDIVFDSYKTKFTEKECGEIIGTSSILYKELVNEK